MKAFVLAVCVLIVAETYAIDWSKVKVFNDNLVECEKKCGLIPEIAKELRPDVVLCTLKKFDVLDKNDHYINDTVSSLCADLTVDAKECEKRFAPCVEKEKNNYDDSCSTHNLKVNLKIIECGICAGTMALVPPEKENATCYNEVLH